MSTLSINPEELNPLSPEVIVNQATINIGKFDREKPGVHFVVA